jgi:hypothetical protein
MGISRAPAKNNAVAVLNKNISNDLRNSRIGTSVLILNVVPRLILNVCDPFVHDLRRLDFGSLLQKFGRNRHNSGVSDAVAGLREFSSALRHLQSIRSR